MQQVNFLKRIVVKKEPFNTSEFFLVCLGFFIILSLVSSYKFVRYLFQLSSYASLQQEEQVLHREINQLAIEHPIIAKERDLLSRVHQLNDQLIDRINVYKRLTKAELKTGFSSYLTILSQKVPSSVSLERIYISQEKNNIVLKGVAYKPNSVTEMVAALYAVPLFKVNPFQKYDIITAKNKVIFQIASNTYRYEVQPEISEKKDKSNQA